LLQFNGRDVEAVEHLATLIAMSTSPAVLQVSRAGNSRPLVVTAELSGPPIGGGCLTRSDPAEPFSEVVTAVLVGSPADRAGLAVGDRVLSSPWMARRDKTPPGGSDELLVERRGRILRLALPRDAVNAGQEPGRHAASAPYVHPPTQRSHTPGTTSTQRGP
jgi:hypothetical protein